MRYRLLEEQFNSDIFAEILAVANKDDIGKLIQSYQVSFLGMIEFDYEQLVNQKDLELPDLRETVTEIHDYVHRELQKGELPLREIDKVDFALGTIKEARMDLYKDKTGIQKARLQQYEKLGDFIVKLYLRARAYEIIASGEDGFPKWVGSIVGAEKHLLLVKALKGNLIRFSADRSHFCMTEKEAEGSYLFLARKLEMTWSNVQARFWKDEEKKFDNRNRYYKTSSVGKDGDIDIEPCYKRVLDILYN